MCEKPIYLCLLYFALYFYFPAFSSVLNPIQPMVERQSYILPASVEAMKETITEKGITNKHILSASEKYRSYALTDKQIKQ